LVWEHRYKIRPLLAPPGALEELLIIKDTLHRIRTRPELPSACVF
jgi:hypothetical protein